MVLRADVSPTAAQRLGALLGAGAPASGPPATRPRRLGVEHEYAVFEGDSIQAGRQVDFRTLVHRLGFAGRVLHPTNVDAILTPSGLAVMADGLVAETASPPEVLAPGASSALAAWGAWGRQVLDAHLPAGLHLFPGSTHVSVETHASRADQLCLWFAQTFAPALMLMMDRADSPGVLVRPRPYRFELGGEFIAGERLQAAATFLAGAVIALEEARALPPAIEVAVEPARRRFGWYVDRTAFGPDLYADGRAAVLSLRFGGATTAQAQLESCWAVARDALGALASIEEIAAVDRLVRGETPLPCEDADWHRGRPVVAPPSNPFGRLEQRRADLRIEPASSTWDYVAFAITHGDHAAIVNVPYPHLAAFLDRFEAGELDDVLADATHEASPTRVLETYAQTGEIGVFGSISAGDALLPRDRMGVGPGVVSTTRPGKIEAPPPPPPRVQPPPPPPPSALPVRRGFPWTWLLVPVVALALGGGGFLFIGGGGEPEPTVTPTPTTAVEMTSTPTVTLTETPTSAVSVAPPVVGPIVAELVVPVTTYRVEASSPDGLPLTYRWFLEADPGEECGTKSPSSSEPGDSSVATWSHANEPPDSCHHDAGDHPFAVRVEVSDGVNQPVLRTYRGSNSGTGPVE